MKQKKIQLAALVASMIPCMGYSQYSISQAVTFALTDTYSAPSLVAKDQNGVPLRGEDGKTSFVYEQQYSTTRGTTIISTQESGSRMVTERISNKQILEALDEAGVIDGIAGYSIALFSSEGEGGVAFHLVKAGSSPINISAYLYPDTEEEGPEASNYSAVRVTSTTSSSEAEPTVIRNTETETGKEGVSLLFQTPSVNVEMYGVLNFTDSLRTVGTGTSRRTIMMPGAGSVSNIIGSSGAPATPPPTSPPPTGMPTEEEDSLIEGRINLSPGVLLPLVG